jgi:predicted NAD-dependent protein-ADP-ribosyltransferase YbiA (DUF1768 family)
MSLHLRFFAAIDRLPSLDTPLLATALGRDWPQFLQRGWVTDEGHVIRALDEFVRVDGEQDVFDASAFDRVLHG